MTELIILIIGVLVLSGVFSGTEAAILSITPAEVETMVHNKRKWSHLLQYVIDHINRSVTASLIVNNIINIAGSMLVGQKVTALYSNAALGIATTALTFGIIIFSEIIPKSLGTHYARRVSQYMSPLLVGFIILFSPLIFPVEYVTKKLLKGERKIGTEAQIRSLVRLGRRQNIIEQDEGQLIMKAFMLNDCTAEDIMEPKENVTALPIDITIKEATDRALKIPHSRYPVYEDDLDDVEGVVLEREILRAFHEGKGDEPLESILRPALLVEDDAKADDLLGLFRDEKSHLAIVRDGGSTIGIVTLEDVLEELVGEIDDEQDVKMRVHQHHKKKPKK